MSEDNHQHAARVSLPRYLLGFSIMVALGFVSWFTISTPTPTISAPWNALVFLPAFLIGGTIGEVLGEVIGRATMWAAVGFMPILFYLWCLPVLRGGMTVPTRSIVLFVCVALVSACDLIFGHRGGIEYQGAHYVLWVSVISVIWWLMLIAALILARQRPSSVNNLRFHVPLFTWLTWYAIPYMGETP